MPDETTETRKYGPDTDPKTLSTEDLREFVEELQVACHHFDLVDEAGGKFAFALQKLRQVEAELETRTD